MHRPVTPQPLLWSLAALALLGIAAFGTLGSGASGQTPPAPASAASNGRAFQYSFGVWGDLPYSDEQALPGVPNLIADMNASDIEFSVHDGDLKAGNATKDSKTVTDCSNGLYTQALGYFGQLNKPAVFTPGDNDWTDCDRPSNGGFNSRERLEYERKVFFSTSNSLGKQTTPMEVQSGALCLGTSGMVQCSESRRWTVRGVTYGTLNVQGSCNNLCDADPDPLEWGARMVANRNWLREIFAAAKANGSSAVVIIAQGNPGWDLADPTRAPTRDPKALSETGQKDPDGYVLYLQALRDEVVAFRKPVLYVHGDSHYFRIDKPLQDAKGLRVENFTRLEPYGNSAPTNNDVHWVKVLVDTASRDVFAFQPQVVPANRVAVPNP